MDDLIDLYLKNNFTEEQQTLFYKAMGLFTVFGMEGYTSMVTEYIMQEGDQHREVIADQVYGYFEEGVNRLINSHRLILTEDTSFGFKVRLLEAIYGLTYRETYQPYQLVMEAYDLDDLQKFAKILSDINELEEETILEHVEWVYDGTVRRMAELISSKAQEEEIVDVELIKKIRKNMFVFESAFGVPKAVTGLVNTEIVKGQPLDVYLQLLKEELIDLGDMESTTWRLLWLALIAGDSTDNPQKFLLERADSLFQEIKLINSFTTMLQKAMGRYSDFKGNQK